MIKLTWDQTVTLHSWFLQDGSSSLVAQHIINTGHGTCLADRWPQPRAIVAETGGNYALHGEPYVLLPSDLQPHVAGFIEAPDRFLPLLQSAFPDLFMWERVVLHLLEQPARVHVGDYLVRRLQPADCQQLKAMSAESAWISKTWGGPAALASSDCAWGALAGDALVSVACVFFMGDHQEELGVVTEPAYRGRGLSVACTTCLCADVFDRGRRPRWSTSPDNRASLRVAEKLGFAVKRRDRLYVVGMNIPEPARPQRV
jgi:RimJ/RimL family protein N-acetyltransferase